MGSNNCRFDKFTFHGVYCPLLCENIVRGKQRNLSIMTFRFKGVFHYYALPLQAKYLLITQFDNILLEMLIFFSRFSHKVIRFNSFDV